MALIHTGEAVEKELREKEQEENANYNAIRRAIHQARYWQALEQLVVDEGLLLSSKDSFDRIIGKDIHVVHLAIKRAKEMVDGDVLAHHSEDKLDMVKQADKLANLRTLQQWVARYPDINRPLLHDIVRDLTDLFQDHEARLKALEGK